MIVWVIFELVILALMVIGIVLEWTVKQKTLPLCIFQDAVWIIWLAFLIVDPVKIIPIIRLISIIIALDWMRYTGYDRRLSEES